MKSELILNFCVKFLKTYKKEILWWVFFIIFSRTIDFNDFAYTREKYEAELAKAYKAKLDKKSKDESIESKED